MAQNDLFRRNFGRILLKWDRSDNHRVMPWKGEKDPYKIWLSEIILQQTRVDQGLKYYEKFIKKYPTIMHLARAKDKTIFKLWEGLGYYNRCRNLIATARFITDQKAGSFPDAYDEIIKLKGVGSYTAAAIASFAFNQPYAVLDGNVYRVLSRVMGINISVQTASGKAVFEKLAHELLDKKQPGLYNQAIMDFGATVCMPRNPACSTCVFQDTCYAFQTGRVHEFPVNSKKPKLRSRWFNYLVITDERHVYINQRLNNDIWNQLYEFFLIETSEELSNNRILQKARKAGVIEKGDRLITASATQNQKLSHQVIHGKFLIIHKKSSSNPGHLIRVKISDLKKYPFPGLISKFLQMNPL